MEQKENIRIEELLPRYCDGNVTMEERHWVEQWMAESEEHQKIVRQMYLINLSADTLSVMNRVQPEKALQKVNRRIRLSEAKLWLHRLEQAAAILFLPLLGLYWFFPRTAEKEVRWLTVQTNPGMTTQLTLPDGSHVSLNSESSISYPEVFTDQTRNVKLSGEAYFEVTKNPEQRFIVSTPHQAAIEVLGTSFNVEAFAQDSTIATTLVEGAVRFKYEGKEVSIQPGEKIVYNRLRNQYETFKTNGVSESSWKDGKLIFRNTPFNEALRMLEKRYYVQFKVSNPKYQQDAFTGTFTNQRLDRILEIFQISSHIKWRYIASQDKSEKKQTIEIY